MAKNFINKDHDAIEDQKYAKDNWGNNIGTKAATSPVGVSAPIGRIGSDRRSIPVGVSMTSQHSGFNSSALISNIFFKSLAEKKMAAALSAQGFVMIGQLAGKSKSELTAMKGVGKVSADKILGVLADV